MISLINPIPSHSSVKIMLLGIVTLLLVLLFLLLLHCYAKWFLTHNPQTRNDVLVLPLSFRAGRLINLRYFENRDDGNNSVSPRVKGLEPRLISSIPQFVYQGQEGRDALECVVCLSLFEDEEKGRRLASCHHSFHIECIDMWLHSHTTCPICRARAVPEKNESDVNEEGEGELFESNGTDSSRLEVVVEVSNVENGLDIGTYQSRVCSSSTKIGDEFDVE